jgi:hypothetical protein
MEPTGQIHIAIHTVDKLPVLAVILFIGVYVPTREFPTQVIGTKRLVPRCADTVDGVARSHLRII